MIVQSPGDALDTVLLDAAVADLQAAQTGWAQTPVSTRIALLQAIMDALLPVAPAWVETASRHKLIPNGSPLVGEEWISGPYALMLTCSGLIRTLSAITDKAYLEPLKKRQTASGQLAVQVVPGTIWDHLLLSGITAEVWMQEGVTADNLAENSASAYDLPPDQRKGGVSLVLGAGNIAAIAPLDCLQKLFLENQVVLLKLNPVNDYLHDVLQVAMAPLIQLGALRIVRGGGPVGAYLCNHPGIDELHITGAEATHDAIVWGPGKEGQTRKAAGTPANPRRMTSELGAVCPTIVVPGPWSDADISFQAQHIATQKMHNSGFNCIACQVLVMPGGWDVAPRLIARVERILSKATRLPYYPGAEQRMEDFASHSDQIRQVARGAAKAAVVTRIKPDGDGWYETNEVFAPALAIREIDQTDPADFLRAAIDYANTHLHGTLGANILIHPRTIRAIGKDRFEQMVAELRYGCIAINAWTGVGFLLTQTPWGAFPGHSLADVQSGIGTVHNTYMFDKSQRSVVRAPWAPFPRSLTVGEFSLLPKPPWFITSKTAAKVGAALTRFQHTPRLRSLPGIFLQALRS